MLRLFGADPLAITLNNQNCTTAQLLEHKGNLIERTQLPVFRILEEGVDELAQIVESFYLNYRRDRE